MGSARSVKVWGNQENVNENQSTVRITSPPGQCQMCVPCTDSSPESAGTLFNILQS